MTLHVKNPFNTITSPGEAWGTLFALVFGIAFLAVIPYMFGGLSEAVFGCAAPCGAIASAGFATMKRGRYHGDESMENRGYWILAIGGLLCILCLICGVVLSADPAL